MLLIIALLVGIVSASSRPQQLHINYGGADDQMIFTWVTEVDMPSNCVTIWPKGTTSKRTQCNSTASVTYTYNWKYTSPFIHHVSVSKLLTDTTYMYTVGNSLETSEAHNFTTSPALGALPVTFGLLGDLGQTTNSEKTRDHLIEGHHDCLLHIGDISYANGNQTLWDRYGRVMQPLASIKPWMVGMGNHEIEPDLQDVSFLGQFKAYNTRFLMPWEASGATSNLYYSLDIGGVHVVFLCSFCDFLSGSEQYEWLDADLSKVDRSVTPWVLLGFHAPWYNTNHVHRDDGIPMKIAMESLVLKHHVNIGFSGHVHAYERMYPVAHDKVDYKNGIPYINIGDGGNKEGLANDWDEDKSWSAYRESSYGQGDLAFVNRTHALWQWHRNQDPESQVADSVWIINTAISE